MKRTWPGLAFIVAMLLVACLLRVHRLGERSLWEDEADSFFGANWSPAWTVNFLLSNGVHPPLYYFLQKVSFPLGASEFAMRLPAAMFSVLGVAAAAKLGRLWLGRGGGGLTAALVALSPFATAFGREARMYSLVALLTCLAMAEFWRMLARQPLGALRLTIVSALLYLTHYFGFFAASIQFLYLLFTFRRHYLSFRWWVVAQGVAFTPVVLWLGVLFNHGAYFKISWIKTPAWQAPLLTLTRYTLGVDSGAWWAAAGGVGALVLAGWAAHRRQGWVPLLALWLVLPPLVTFGISLRRPVYVDRYLIGSLPALMLALAAGLIAVFQRQRWAGSVLALGLIGSMAWQSTLELDRLQCHLCVKENWRAAAAYLTDYEQPGDQLWIRSIFNFGMNYYYRGRLTMQAMDGGAWRPEPAAALAGRRVWVVYRGNLGAVESPAEIGAANFYQAEPDPLIRDWLWQTRLSLVEWHDFGSVVVLRYDFPTRPSGSAGD